MVESESRKVVEEDTKQRPCRLADQGHDPLKGQNPGSNPGLDAQFGSLTTAYARQSPCGLEAGRVVLSHEEAEHYRPGTLVPLWSNSRTLGLQPRRDGA